MAITVMSQDTVKWSLSKKEMGDKESFKEYLTFSYKCNRRFCCNEVLAE